MSQTGPDRKSRRWVVALIRLLAKLPLPLLYLLADALFFLLFYLLRFQRQLVIDNLSGAFTDRSPAEIRRLAARAYRNALHFLFETIRSFSFTENQLARRVEIDNPDLIEALVQRYRTVLCLASHQGNWEWLQLACAAQLAIPLAALYKPLGHGEIDHLLLQVRSRFGSELFEAGTGLPELIRFARQPGIIALNADQGPRPDEDKYWGHFLGRDTAFYPGPEKLARLFKAPVVFAHMQRLRRGYYRIRFELLAEPPYPPAQGAIMDRYIQALEEQIQSAPQDWFWVYKRWKYQRSVYES